MKTTDYMRIALEQAQMAAAEGEVPVGALIVRAREVIALGRNMCERMKDATAHAEMLAIRQAAGSIGDWRLEECTLYCTLEPCAMCAGAIINSRIRRVVFGAGDAKAGALGGTFDLTHMILGCGTQAVGGVLAGECSRLIAGVLAKKR